MAWLWAPGLCQLVTASWVSDSCCNWAYVAGFLSALLWVYQLIIFSVTSPQYSACLWGHVCEWDSSLCRCSDIHQWFHFCWLVSPTGKIISNFLKPWSASGRAKAFSTCSSHLTVVVLFYGTASTTYLQPKYKSIWRNWKLISLFYSLEPNVESHYIYSDKNAIALRKLLSKLSTWLRRLKLQKQFVFMFLM